MPLPIPKNTQVVVEADTLSDAEKTRMRLQIGSLKKKIKDIQTEIAAKDAEIEKLRAKTSDKVRLELDNELRRAYEVLRHLKKKVGSNAFNEEYKIVMSEIRTALQADKD